MLLSHVLFSHVSLSNVLLSHVLLNHLSWNYVNVLDPIMVSVLKKIICFLIQSPWGTVLHQLGESFVNDTSIFNTNNTLSNGTHPNTLILHTQKVSQDFERKLYSSGGDLSLQKCFWCLIHWTWQPNGTATMSTTQQLPGDIHLTQGRHKNILMNIV